MIVSHNTCKCQSDDSNLLEMRYCLKALEYYLFSRACKVEDKNEDLGNEFNLKDFFENDASKQGLFNEKGKVPYDIKNFYSKHCAELKKSNKKDFKYNVILTKLPDTIEKLPDTIEKDDNYYLAKIWLFFIFLAYKYYDKIVKKLNGKISSFEKKNYREAKVLKSSCLYFTEYYGLKISEYEMFLDSFKYFCENKDPAKIWEYVQENYKNVFIPSYKDLMFIDYRRSKTVKSDDTGFDSFPTSLFK